MKKKILLTGLLCTTFLANNAMGVIYNTPDAALDAVSAEITRQISAGTMPNNIDGKIYTSGDQMLKDLATQVAAFDSTYGVGQGAKLLNDIKDQWMQALNNGETTIKDIVDDSKREIYTLRIIFGQPVPQHEIDKVGFTDQESLKITHMKDALAKIGITDSSKLTPDKMTPQLQAQIKDIINPGADVWGVMSSEVRDILAGEVLKEYKGFLAGLDDPTVWPLNVDPQAQRLLGNSDKLVAANNLPSTQEVLKEKIESLKAQGVNSANSSAVQEMLAVFLTPTDNLKDLSTLTPIQKPDTVATDSLLASMDTIGDIIDSRMSTHSVFTSTYGVAAGDEAAMPYGVWVKGAYTNATQKEYKLVPGYKLTQGGGTIGFDYGEDENELIGIAYSYLDTTANAKDIGIKDKLHSHMITSYGAAKFDNNFLVNGQIKAGMSNINKTRENRNNSKGVSKGKTKGYFYGGKIELGYDHALENKVHLVPTIGISYEDVFVDHYKEKGPGFNRSVGNRHAKKGSGLLGFKVAGSVDAGSYVVIPEIHANLFYAFYNKNDKTVIRILNGVSDFTTPSGKKDKMSYKIGGSLKFTQLGNVDIGVGYDCGLAKKFTSHTGYVNAKIKF